MPRFAANLSLLFAERGFLERFGAAARAGFSAVECQFPYAWPAAELAAALAENRLEMVLHNLPAGDWTAGERGIACHPGRIAEFREGIELALEYARVLRCPRLNCLAGVVPSGVSLEAARETFVANLRFAAKILAREGRQLLIEPINTFDIPGFLLHHSRDAASLVEDVGEPNLFIQYDIYHAQRMEGELGGTLARLLPHIGHIQLADNPGRHEPGSGEINFPWLLRHLDALGYAGWIGCEYLPAAGTEAGLGWLREFQANELREGVTRHCFTYGSLMCEDIMAAVCAVPVGSVAARPANLAGYVRHPVAGETYPGMIPSPEDEVQGRLYLDLPPAAWPRLDRFEGEMYKRQAVNVRLEDGSEVEAEAYVFRPEFVGRLATGEWNFAAFLREGKNRFTGLYLGFQKI